MEYNHLNITLKSIYYFLAVVENKSVTKAAQKLYITQPLLSKKLMALEAETGVRLMEREGRGIRITRAGEYLYAEWKVLIDQYEKSVIHGALIENVPVEHMNVGCFPVLHVSSFLMPYLEQLNDISPDLTVKVKRENYTLLLEDLQEGRLDVAFMMLSDLPMGQECFEWEEVDACTLVCVANKNSPLSGKKNISFEELNGQNIFLGRPEGSPGGISAIHELCREHGVCPGAVHYVNSDVTAFINVEMGRGITLGPELYYSDNSPKASLIPVENVRMKIGAVWCRDINWKMKEFIQAMLHYSNLE